MATKHPRMQITVPIEIKDKIEYAAGEMGIPASRLVTQILEEASPHLVLMAEALSDAKKKPIVGFSRLSDVISNAQNMVLGAQVDIEEMIARQSSE